MYATGMQGLEIKIKPNNLCNIIFEIKSIGPILNQPILMLIEIFRIIYKQRVTNVLENTIWLDEYKYI